MLLLVFVVLCVVKVSSSNEYSMQDSGRGCVYNFQVWEPNQDVLSQLRRLDNRCSNISSHFQQQVALLKNQFLGEVVSSRNFSQSLERDIMQQKVEKLQLDVTTKDLQMQLMNLKAEMKRLGRGRGGGGVNEEVLGSLKNAVGDLKAEWLLIKRDVQVVRSEAERQNDEHETYAVQMKEEVQGLKEGSLRLSRRQEELRDEVNSFTEADSKGEMDRLRREQSQLYSKVAKLEADLRSLQSQHSALAQQLLAVVMETFNATNDALTSWVKKMPAIRTEPEWDRNPRDCHEVYESGHRVSGVYQVQFIGMGHPTSVYCQMDKGIGWTVLQRRVDGSLSFNRRWLEYKYGFGNLYSEFWLGNEQLHKLTRQQKYRLRVDLWDWEGNVTAAEYDSFRIHGEDKKYKLHVDHYRGSSVAGDSLSYHSGMSFSTEDMDNDEHSRNCAQDDKGGWWFNRCYSSHLNGIYHTGWYTQETNYADGIVWFTLKQSEYYSLRKVEMKVAPSFG